MRKFKFTLIAFMAAMMALSFTACSDDDPEPNPNPDPEVNEDNYHFDLFVTVDKHGGMSSKNTTIVHSVNSLAAEQGVITVKREGSNWEITPWRLSLKENITTRFPQPMTVS